jgi:hypothetical protein
VARQVPPDSQDSAKAMQRELDFVENDWGALFWALGSTTAIFRYSFPRALKTSFGILLLAITLATHFLVHIATHSGGP